MLEKRAVVDPEKCDRCLLCPVTEICPAGAIEREDDEDPYFINSYCQGCGKCVTACPQGAIKIV